MHHILVSLSALAFATVACRPLPPAPSSDTTLTVSARIDSSLSPDSPAVIQRSVVNAGDTAVSLDVYGGGLAFDAVVTDSSGTEVWHRVGGLMAPMAQRLTIDHADSVTYHAVWDVRNRLGVPLAPGEYRLAARLLDDRGDPIGRSAAPVVFRVAARRRGE